VKFTFMEQNRSAFPIKLLCTLMQVARSSFYAYLKRRTAAPSRRHKENAVLTEKIKTLFEASQQRYGSPRIHAALRQQGETCSLGRVKRLMRRVGLYAVSARKFKPRKERIVKLETPNLLLQHSIRPSAINQVWHSEMA
jgi:putative transposase